VQRFELSRQTPRIGSPGHRRFRNPEPERICLEIRATGGGLRRVCYLFGLSIRGAERYTAILDPPGLDMRAPIDNTAGP
jgi:hypothetical protein